jgi:phosphoserine phosphatase RsbU/P
VRPVAGRFAATLYAVFNPDTRKLVFSNAGLPLPLLISESGCTTLGEGGLPSGMFPHATYESYSAELSPGAAVLFASDGLHELRDRHNEDFGRERLMLIWQLCRRKSADELLSSLFEEARSFCLGGSEQLDDITAVMLKIPG